MYEKDADLKEEKKVVSVHEEVQEERRGKKGQIGFLKDSTGCFGRIDDYGLIKVDSADFGDTRTRLGAYQLGNYTSSSGVHTYNDKYWTCFFICLWKEISSDKGESTFTICWDLKLRN
ncbi:hypothetical protein Tco_0174040 [Tanacetum coccineum]